MKDKLKLFLCENGYLYIQYPNGKEEFYSPLNKKWMESCGSYSEEYSFDAIKSELGKDKTFEYLGAI